MTESLPSHSMFVRHVEKDEPVGFGSIQSPPPPPPPLPANSARTSVTMTTPTSGGNTRRNTTSSEKKAFLKKGSRIEPSALNRSNKTPSPVTIASSSILDSEGDEYSINAPKTNSSSHKPLASNGSQKTAFSHPTAYNYDDSRDDDLSPEKSLGIAEDTQELGSTWKAKKENAKKELDEFLLLEREVEVMDLDPFASRNTLRFSGENQWSPYSSATLRSEETGTSTAASTIRPTVEMTAASSASTFRMPDLAQGADQEFRKASRPSLSALHDVPGVTVTLPSSGMSKMQLEHGGYASSSPARATAGAGMNLQKDYGIYDFDEDCSPADETTFEPANVSNDDSPAHRHQKVDDSQSWGAVTRPGSSGPAEYDSMNRWGATSQSSQSPGKAHTRSPSPSPGQAVIRPRTSVSSSNSRPPTGNRAMTPTSSGRHSSQGSPAGADMGAEALLLQKTLKEKAKELETELATYRQENSQLKSLRKQQEQALNEIAHQRTELTRYVNEEKSKTEAWCEEQRNAANKERRAAAKVARDSRQAGAGGGLTTRKERAELEALQSTIEKMKIDATEARKKSRMNEQRLNQLLKDNSQALDDSQQACSALENEILTLLKYLDQAAVRIPSSVLGKQLGKLKKQQSEQQKSSGKSTYRSSYVEEIAVDDVLVGGSSALYETASSSRFASNAHDDKDEDDQDDDAEFTRTGGLADAIFHRSLSAGPARGDGDLKTMHSTYSSTAYDPLRYTTQSSTSFTASAEQERSKGVIKSLIQASQAASPGRLSAKKDRESYQRDSDASLGGLRGASVLGSWTRSSRSSRETHSSRYSNNTEDEDDDRDDGYPAQDQDDDEDDAGQEGSFRLPSSEPAATSRPAPSSPHKAIVINTGSSAGNGSASNSTGISSYTAPSTPPTTESSTRTEELLPDGRKIVRYRNGTVKEVFPDGHSVVRFLNGDTKRTLADGSTVVYYYAHAETTHTTYKDGLEVYEFPNRQVRSALLPLLQLPSQSNPHMITLYRMHVGREELSRWNEGNHIPRLNAESH